MITYDYILILIHIITSTNKYPHDGNGIELYSLHTARAAYLIVFAEH